MPAPEAVIRLCPYDPCIITTEQYDAIWRDVMGRYHAGCTEEGDRVLARLLYEHEGRYHECIRTNAARGLDKP